MDTRNKIISPNDAVRVAADLREKGVRLNVVTGYFDPLLAGHARRIRELARSGSVLMLILNEPANPLLTLKARAELVAGLGVVDYVVLPAAGGLDGLLEQIPASGVFREEASDQRRTVNLVRHVHNRQSSL